jgi:WD40 repeat protein/serine/threonine protein kinase
MLLDALGEDAPGRFGDYELIEEIARGGMGVVWRARQLSLNRTVAVKLMLAGTFAQPESIKRFRLEAEAAASLQHPNIVAIHEIGEHDGQPYFSMDYVEGQSLAQLVRERPLPARRAAAYLKTIAEAVHYAHEHHVLHRDLKPSNILIDAADQPRITDFGLAKRLTDDADLTISGQVLGSPNFLPPEQAEARHDLVGPASDVYSLGAVLYFLLTGRAPFQAASVPDTLRQVASADPLSPRLLNPSVPRDLETLCLKCLDKEISRRYGTAQELADELVRFIRGEPIRARPLGPTAKSIRWCRRNPRLAVSLAALVLVFLLGFAGVTWEWRRAERSDTEARRSLYTADLNLAMRAHDENNRGRVLELLARHRPQPGQDDLRGWEWRYLWQECRGGERLTLGEFPGAVTWVNFSPDSQRLAACDISGLVRLWPAPFTGTPSEAQVGTGNNSLCFTPDGSRLILASYYRRGVDLWSLAERRTVATLPTASRLQPHHMAALSPSGDRIALNNDDGRFEVWDARALTNLVSLPGEKTCVIGIEWSPDGRWIASGEQPNRICLRDGATYAKRFEWPCPSGMPLRTFAFTRDGEYLAAAANDHTTRVWSTRSGQLAFTLTNHSARVCAVVVAPDGRHLATASADQTLRLWDTSTWCCTAVLRGHEDEIHAVAFSPDGRCLASGSKDGVVKLWDATPPPERPRVWSVGSNDAGVLLGPELAADGRRFIVWRRDGRLETWDALRLELLRTTQLDTNHYGQASDQLYAVTWAALSPGAERLALGYGDGGLTVFDLAPPPTTAPTAAGQPSETASRLWHRVVPESAPAAAPTNPTLLDRGTAISRLVFSRDGALLAGSCQDHSIRVWDAATGEERARFDGQCRWHFALAVSPDGKRIAAGNENRVIRWWRWPEGTLGGELREPRLMHIRGLAFSPDGNYLASASLDNRVRLWDLRANTLAHAFPRTLLSFRSVTFTPDGRRVLAGTSGGGLIQLWNVADAQELATLKAGPGAVLGLAFADADHLVSVTPSEVRLWPAASP